jgi:hypothetical protein
MSLTAGFDSHCFHRFWLAAAPATDQAMRSRRVSLTGLVCLTLVATGCGSSSSGDGAAGNERSLFDSRYCEVFLVEIEGDVAIVNVFNTVGFSECRSELWDVLDTDEIADEQGVSLAVLNGPRFWVIDGAAAGDAVTAEIENFGGITMQKVAEIQLPLAQALELQSRANPYAEVVVDRDNAWVFSAGREIYELIDPDGGAYVMQSYSHQVDDGLTSAVLPSLGDRLQLPAGWTFRARLVPSELVLQATGQAIVTQDELRNTYQKY